MTYTTEVRPTDVGPAGPAGLRSLEVIAEHSDYADAQRTVDRLSDLKFPVDSVRIVGTGIRSVEDVTGRVTKGRAALLGAGTGAWIGLLIGLMVGMFTIGPAWFGLLLAGAGFGALWGALFGFLAHAATRGRRDFRSVRRLEAERYQVQVDTPLAAEAARLIA